MIQKQPENIHIKRSVYERIQKVLRYNEVEKGVILGEKNEVVTDFCLDRPGKLYSYKYEPNTAYLNSIIARWAEKGIEFCGMIHSHPANYNELSYADRIYARYILENNTSLKRLYFGITWESEKGYELKVWRIRLPEAEEAEMQIHLIE